MTHTDTDVKNCAAEFLFILCKESGKRPGLHRPTYKALHRTLQNCNFGGGGSNSDGIQMKNKSMNALNSIRQ